MNCFCTRLSVCLSVSLSVAASDGREFNLILYLNPRNQRVITSEFHAEENKLKRDYNEDSFFPTSKRKRALIGKGKLAIAIQGKNNFYGLN